MKPWSKQSIEQQFDELQRLHRRQFWTGAAESIACGLLGLLLGIAYGLGYLADLPAYLR